MIQQLINTLNNVLKGSNLILHIEEEQGRSIKSIVYVTYSVYINTKSNPKPIKLVSLTRTKKLNEDNYAIEKEFTESFLIYIINGGLQNL